MVTRGYVSILFKLLWLRVGYMLVTCWLHVAKVLFPCSVTLVTCNQRVTHMRNQICTTALPTPWSRRNVDCKWECVLSEAETAGFLFIDLSLIRVK